MKTISVSAPNKPKRPIKPVKLDGNGRVIKKGDSRKPVEWRITLGKKITGTKKVRKFFETEAAANKYIDDMLAGKEAKGAAAFDIPNNLAVEAMELSKELKVHGATLTEAVRFFMRHAPKGGSKKVNELVPDYLATKEKAIYRKAQEISLRIFQEDFGNRPVSSIFANDLEKWFNKKKWNPLNKRNYMRDISMFFNWCKLRDYRPDCPMDKVKRPKVHLKTPEVYTIDEVKKILRAAKKNPDLGLYSMYVIAFFTGMRVEEMERMTWDMVVWNEGEIRLPETVTKTHRPRIIPISPVLRAWLESETGTTGGIVVKANLKNRKKQLLKEAGVKPKRNALRHSFASYHASLYRNNTDLQLILGQKTAIVLYNHYLAAAKQVDAKAYFELNPAIVLTEEEEESPRSDTDDTQLSSSESQ